MPTKKTKISKEFLMKKRVIIKKIWKFFNQRKLKKKEKNSKKHNNSENVKNIIWKSSSFGKKKLF